MLPHTEGIRETGDPRFPLEIQSIVYDLDIMAMHFVLSATESSVLEWSRPQAAAIQGALSSLSFPPAIHWVGPAPRITRKATLGDLYSFRTTVTWILAIEGPLTPEGALMFAREQAGRVQQALRGISADWSNVSVTTYTEAIHGPLAWWQNGNAAVSRTRDDFLTSGLQHLAADDNPVGPNSPLTRTPTQGEGLQAGANQVGKAVKNVLRPIEETSKNVVALLVIGAVVVGGVVAWPYISTAFAATQRRKNPRRSRR